MYITRTSSHTINIIISVFVFTGLTYAQDMWIETTQEDFRDGVYERNLYASHLGGGAVEYAPRFDLNNDGYMDLFTADRSGPYANIFWGDAGGYSSSNVTQFPTNAAGNCDAADLNGDGYADFVVMHFRYGEKLSIYWGSPTGPSSTNATHIPVFQEGENCCIADFNKDGYLDIVTGASLAGYGAVFWGSASGFSFNSRTDLPQGVGQHNIEVADFNKDTWLDIMYPEYISSSLNRATIFWGSASGFSPQQCTYLPGIMCLHGLSIADLDGNEYLDVILTFWYDPQSYIYWGSEAGYSSANMQVLNPGYCYGGSTVADMNEDGYLDIVYHRGGYGSHQQGIYWGSASGYSDGNVTWVGVAIEASGGTVADYNADGDLDIFTNVVTPGSESYIFWGPDYTTNTALPVNDDHHGMFREIGDVYTREYRDDYMSSIFDAAAHADWSIIEWDASLPQGSDILFWVRSGDTPAPDASWSTWHNIFSGTEIPSELNARFLQYRARFSYANPCHLPALNAVTVTYDTSSAIPASVDIKPQVINLASQGKFTAFITLPDPYSHQDIDGSTVVCEGAAAITGKVAPKWFMAKFRTSDLTGLKFGPAVELMVTGELFDGTCFCGYDTVRVIDHDGIVLTCTVNPLQTYTAFIVSACTEVTVTMRIYDVNGMLVRDLGSVDCSPDLATIVWDGQNKNGSRVPAGIYFCRAESLNDHAAQKMIVIE
jgi:hypothetical protein